MPARTGIRSWPNPLKPINRHLWVPILFKGQFHIGRDTGLRPTGLWQERAKTKLLAMWHDTEVGAFLAGANVRLFDYRAPTSAVSIGPDLVDPKVMYDVIAPLDDEALMMAILRFNVMQDRPELPCF